LVFIQIIINLGELGLQIEIYILTEIGPALPLTPDPHVICFF
jgi:hypothetical protein